MNNEQTKKRENYDKEDCVKKADKVLLNDVMDEYFNSEDVKNILLAERKSMFEKLQRIHECAPKEIKKDSDEVIVILKEEVTDEYFCSTIIESTKKLINGGLQKMCENAKEQEEQEEQPIFVDCEDIEFIKPLLKEAIDEVVMSFKDFNNKIYLYEVYTDYIPSELPAEVQQILSDIISGFKGMHIPLAVLLEMQR